MPARRLQGAKDGRPFPKGQSGNPGGRPKIEREIVDLARSHSMEAIETLVRIMRSGKPAEALAASNAILDRAFGRPKQTVDARVSRDIRELSDEELIAVITGDETAESVH